MDIIIPIMMVLFAIFGVLAVVFVGSLMDPPDGIRYAMTSSAYIEWHRTSDGSWREMRLNLTTGTVTERIIRSA